MLDSFVPPPIQVNTVYINQNVLAMKKRRTNRKSAAVADNEDLIKVQCLILCDTVRKLRVLSVTWQSSKKYQIGSMSYLKYDFEVWPKTSLNI